MHVLVVDDDVSVRRTLSRALERLGTKVTQAGSAQEALEAVSRVEQPYAAIFCDLHMPDRDGVQMLRDFVQRDVKSAIVLLSGTGGDILAAAESTARHHGLHVLGQLSKPLDRERISELLRMAAEPRRTTVRHQTPSTLSAADVVRGLEAGEFTAAFQPKVNPQTRKILGVESLARWNHVIHGPIPPGVFIALAEEHDLIDRLTYEILDNALGGIRSLRELGSNFELAINLSTRSMEQLELPDKLYAIVRKYGLNPETITLEVTESRLVEKLVDFLEISTRLRLKGFKLSIDDFATGFSTLEQIARLPVSELKMDRSLVAGTPTNARTREILKASLEMGHKLGLSCICEGVETEAEWNLVQACGADGVQGYFVARPMTLTALVPWAQSQSA